MLRSLLHKMKNYYKVISTRLHRLYDKLKVRALPRFQRFRPRPRDIEVPDDTTAVDGPTPEVVVSTPSEPFEESLLLAAERQSNPDYLPLGNTHELSSPAGLYLLSQARDYIVYTPSGYRLDEELPLVMVLHGCKQTHLDIRAASGFDEVADRERFIVVYPFVTRYIGMRNLNCWGWWQRFHVRSGTGEVEDLNRIIEQVQGEFTVDKERIHITGLSSGAAMSVAALVAHGKLFASGASVAGVAYGESARAVRINQFLSVKYHSIANTVRRMKTQLKGKGKLAPLLIIQSQNDQTVELQSALNLRDSWLEVKRARKERPDPIAHKTRDIGWEYRLYQRGSTSTPVETLLVEKLKHGWIGGNPAKYSESRGPNISEIIWLFFKRHPR
ncbi:extracellular catalytic domain type 1 short-chain-length polyhydroxyalkanoate depolymerase [Leucothrix pacifica]|nr:PHB depolymerase family esterase [Leucothrix pacifica]